MKLSFALNGLGITFKVASAALLFSSASLAYSAAFWMDATSDHQRQSLAHSTDSSSHPLIRASAQRNLSADYNAIKQYLLNKETSQYELDLPLPDGTTLTYVLSSAPLLSEALQEAYPEWQQFKGYAKGAPEYTGRFDISALGFRGVFATAKGEVVLDPVNTQSKQQYGSYWKADTIASSAFVENYNKLTDTRKRLAKQEVAALTTGSETTLKSYRFAAAADFGFTDYYGGANEALSGIITILNRINQVYERDLGIHFELVTGTETIFTSSFSNPYNTSLFNAEENTDINQVQINNIVGANNYDIGHLFSTVGSGGLAYVGTTCVDDLKAGAYSGFSSPTGDGYSIDLVAHEVGHQLGAHHTFNGEAESCSGNRTSTSAVEPGSGSTIMSYAGVCGDQDLQTYSDDYFHGLSIETIRTYITSGDGSTCGISQNQSNSTPTVDAGDKIFIPAQTPFMLTGTASDPEGDALTYTWEQIDTGASSANASQMVDNGDRPLFRSWLPSRDSTRYLPRLTDLIDGELSLGETLPTEDRVMNFRLTVRQQDASSGEDILNSNYDDKQVEVVKSAGPFALTYPNTNEVWHSGETRQICWDVANTDQSPIDCSNVDIILSDGGTDFSGNNNRLLADNVLNTGEASILVPTTLLPKSRIMVQCSNNTFFALSSASISINDLGTASPQFSGDCSNITPPPEEPDDDTPNVDNGTGSNDIFTANASESRVGDTNVYTTLLMIFAAGCSLLLRTRKKWLALLALTTLSACSSAQKPNNHNDIDEQVAQATQQGDFRLYALNGRKLAILGVQAEQQQHAKALCGIRYLGNKDFLSSDEDKAELQTIKHNARLYNQKMWAICQEQSVTATQP